MAGFLRWLTDTEFTTENNKHRHQPLYATSTLHPKVGQWYPWGQGVGTVQCLHCGEKASRDRLDEVTPPIAAADMCRVLADKYGTPPPKGIS